MANVFKQQADITEHPNLNNFDGFFQNHLTMKAGYLYPFMCKPTVPGDVFRINTAFGIKAMPLNFPIQSTLKAKIAYCYVPNRILMDDWKDMMAGVDKENGDTIVHPYISQASNPEFWKTGSLADYLDIPTTLISSESTVVPWPCDGVENLGQTVGMNDNTTGDPETPFDGTGCRITHHSSKVDMICWLDQTSGVVAGMSMADLALSYQGVNHTAKCGFTFKINAGFVDFKALFLTPEYARFLDATMLLPGANKPFGLYAQLTTDDSHMTGCNWVKIADFDDNSSADIYFSGSVINIVPNSNIEKQLIKIHTANGGSIRLGIGVDYNLYDSNLASLSIFCPTSVGVEVDLTESLDASQSPSALKAYDPADSNGLRINALPFRAYEACCNAFFRNVQIDPFIVGGKKVYNKFNTTTAQGADTTNYSLYKVNWEPDPYTTCMPSPMAGAVQPLVGMSKLGTVTITDENGIATTGQVKVDGSTLTGEITITNPSASAENNRTLSTAAMAAAGMSIYDFRAANAFTRFLETTLRTGYKYYDFIRGHFGKGPKRAELDMPLFLGGASQQITVSQVTQTSQGDSNSPLGSFAGQANCFGGSKHDVNFTCDDYGWIMGLIWIQPTPAYSQVLPKHFIAKDRFDYYFNEFANLGMQPITLAEIAPLQARIDSGSPSLKKTFGYQRPYYDLVQYTDQVHGQFRSSLKDMLINRLFPGVPELGEQFIKVQPEETSNIFAVDAPAEDNYIGQIVVDCKMKRPIPRVSIPSLGR